MARKCSAKFSLLVLIFIAGACGPRPDEPVNNPAGEPTGTSARPGATGDSAQAGGLAGLTQDAYLALFLDTDDFGGELAMTQDTRLKGPDPGDTAWSTYNGMFCGFSVWMSGMDKAMWRVVDIRYVFPSAGQAEGYIKDSYGQLSEGQQEVTGAPSVGSNCKVYGGAYGMAGVSIVNYFYIFRVENVVVKLYAAEGQNVTAEKLTPELLSVYATKIQDRIKKNLQ